MIRSTNLFTTDQFNLSHCVPMTTTLGASFGAIINSGVCLIAGNYYLAAEDTTQKVIQLVLFSGLGFLGGAVVGGVVGGVAGYCTQHIVSCFDSSEKMEAILAHV